MARLLDVVSRNEGRFSWAALSLLFGGIAAIVIGTAFVDELRVPLGYLGWCSVAGCFVLVGLLAVAPGASYGNILASTSPTLRVLHNGFLWVWLLGAICFFVFGLVVSVLHVLQWTGVI